MMDEQVVFINKRNPIIDFIFGYDLTDIMVFNVKPLNQDVIRGLVEECGISMEEACRRIHYALNVGYN